MHTSRIGLYPVRLSALSGGPLPPSSPPPPFRRPGPRSGVHPWLAMPRGTRRTETMAALCAAAAAGGEQGEPTRLPREPGLGPGSGAGATVGEHAMRSGQTQMCEPGRLGGRGRRRASRRACPGPRSGGACRVSPAAALNAANVTNGGVGAAASAGAQAAPGGEVHGSVMRCHVLSCGGAAAVAFRLSGRAFRARSRVRAREASVRRCCRSRHAVYSGEGSLPTNFRPLTWQSIGPPRPPPIVTGPNRRSMSSSHARNSGVSWLPAQTSPP